MAIPAIAARLNKLEVLCAIRCTAVRLVIVTAAEFFLLRRRSASVATGSARALSATVIPSLPGAANEGDGGGNEFGT